MLTGQSGGCLSTVWGEATCVMVKTRPAQRNTDAGSVPRSDAQPAQGEVLTKWFTPRLRAFTERLLAFDCSL